MSTVEPRSALRAARTARGWSQADAARELAALARDRGMLVAAPTSLKTQLSRWENGHARPEAPYRTLLDQLFGGAELGLHTPSDGTAPPDAATRLRERLAVAAAVDAEVVALWTGQLSAAGELDDRLGAAGAVGLVDALLGQLEAVLPHLPDPPRRRAVAALLARAALLAGAQALDAGDPDTAATRFARAGEAAELARAPALAVDAAVGRAEVLVEVGEPAAALAELEHAPHVPAARGRLMAALAVTRAAVGDADGCREALATALATARATGIDRAAAPAGLVVELEHRHGRALALLGDPLAAAHLDRALAAQPTAARERATLHARLARSLTAAGHTAAAADHAAAARALALRTGSRRVLRLLDGQPVPGATVPSSSSAAR